MNRRTLLKFFLLQVGASLLAVLSFSQVNDRKTAALIAGFGFVALGVAQLVVMWKWPDRVRSALFWVNGVYLFLASLPMWILRIFTVGDFSQVLIFGIPSGPFHRLSEVIFLVMVIATWVDWFRRKKA